MPGYGEGKRTAVLYGDNRQPGVLELNLYSPHGRRKKCCQYTYILICEQWNLHHHSCNLHIVTIGYCIPRVFRVSGSNSFGDTGELILLCKHIFLGFTNCLVKPKLEFRRLRLTYRLVTHSSSELVSVTHRIELLLHIDAFGRFLSYNITIIFCKKERSCIPR